MTLILILAYVDDTLVAQGGLSKAAILGKQGGVWAATKGYTVSHRNLGLLLRLSRAEHVVPHPALPKRTRFRHQDGLFEP